MIRSLLILSIVLAAVARISMAQTSPAPMTPDCGCEAQDLPEVLAIVNGVKITRKDIDAQVSERVNALQQQVVEARQRELDLQINSKLLEAEARKRQISTIKLLEEEVVSKIKIPTEAEAQAFYDQNKARINAEFKDVRDDIIGHLRRERGGEEAQRFAERLRAAASVKILVQNVTPPASPSDRARVFAIVNGERITSEEIESSLRPLVQSLQEQVYQLRQKELDLRINDALLEQEAQKRGVTTNALLDAEVRSKLKPVTETDARAFYDQNRERIDGDFAQVKDQVIRYTQERASRDAQMAFAERLRRAAAIQMFLQPPEPPVYNIATDDQPAQGSPTAPVTVIEFLDYQCQRCAAMRPVIEQLLKDHEGRVRFVVRDFPLEQHADAFKAAEAAEAAREQGKYWEYVALLMRHQSELGEAKLKEYATSLALDRQKFDAALDSGKFSEKVQRDIHDGLKLGVSRTPTIFVNGRKVSEVDSESLKAAIERALKVVAKK